MRTTDATNFTPRQTNDLARLLARKQSTLETDLAGKVDGPDSAVDDRIATFDGTTGKVIQDSGKSVSDFATAAQGAKADTAVQPADLADVATSGASSDVTYDNTISGLTATNVKAAIDELAGAGGGTVESVTGTGGVAVNNTDAANPVASLDFTNPASDTSLAGTEEVLMSDGGTVKKTTTQAIADLVPDGVAAPTSSTFPVGVWALCRYGGLGNIADGSTVAGSDVRLLHANEATFDALGAAQTGTWMNVSGTTVDGNDYGYFVRTA